MSDIGQRKTQGLAGSALMGDPDAMESLKMRDPAMAAQVQQQQQQQAAQARQSELARRAQQFEFAKAFSDAQDKFAPRLAKFTKFEDAKREHERLLQSDPLYRMANSGGTLPDGTEIPADPEFSEDDFMNLRMNYGGGFGDMEFGEVMDRYEKNPIVQGMLKTRNAATSIAQAYNRAMENPKDQAAQFNVAKAAIQMIEDGVVRPEEFAAAAGFAWQPGMTAQDVLQVAKGALTKDQVTNLARMGVNAFNAKVANVKDLQGSMIEAGLGSYDPDKLFSTARATPIEINFDGAVSEPEPQPEAPITYTDPETGTDYQFPSQEAYQRFLRERGDQ